MLSTMPFESIAARWGPSLHRRTGHTTWVLRIQCNNFSPRLKFLVGANILSFLIHQILLSRCPAFSQAAFTAFGIPNMRLLNLQLLAWVVLLFDGCLAEANAVTLF